MSKIEFQTRIPIDQIEEGADFAPRVDDHGLLPCIRTDATNGDLLMLGWMTDNAFWRTIEAGEALYFSTARHAL